LVIFQQHVVVTRCVPRLTPIVKPSPPALRRSGASRSIALAYPKGHAFRTKPRLSTFSHCSLCETGTPNLVPALEAAQRILQQPRCELKTAFRQLEGGLPSFGSAAGWLRRMRSMLSWKESAKERIKKPATIATEREIPLEQCTSMTESGLSSSAADMNQ